MGKKPQKQVPSHLGLQYPICCVCVCVGGEGGLGDTGSRYANLHEAEESSLCRKGQGHEKTGMEPSAQKQVKEQKLQE